MIGRGQRQIVHHSTDTRPTNNLPGGIARGVDCSYPHPTAQPRDTIVMDNRAVSKVVAQAPHLQSSDYDLHSAAHHVITAKRLTMRWPGGGGRGDYTAPRTPTTPPPPLGASGQRLVAKGVALRCPWAPKAPDAP